MDDQLRKFSVTSSRCFKWVLVGYSYQARHCRLLCSWISSSWYESNKICSTEKAWLHLSQSPFTCQTTHAMCCLNSIPSYKSLPANSQSLCSSLYWLLMAALPLFPTPCYFTKLWPNSQPTDLCLSVHAQDKNLTKKPVPTDSPNPTCWKRAQKDNFCSGKNPRNFTRVK